MSSECNYYNIIKNIWIIINVHIHWKETKSILITWSLEVFKEELIKSVFYCLSVSCTSGVSSTVTDYTNINTSLMNLVFVIFRIYLYTWASGEAEKLFQLQQWRKCVKWWTKDLLIRWTFIFSVTRVHAGWILYSFQNRNLCLWGNLWFLLCFYCIHVETRFFVSIILNDTHIHMVVSSSPLTSHMCSCK